LGYALKKNKKSFRKGVDKPLFLCYYIIKEREIHKLKGENKMTALEIVKSKGYNPFKTKLVRLGNVYKVYDKVKNEVIVTFTYTPEGNQKVLAK
jgi:hypothetical protein